MILNDQHFKYKCYFSSKTMKHVSMINNVRMCQNHSTSTCEGQSLPLSSTHFVLDWSIQSNRIETFLSCRFEQSCHSVQWKSCSKAILCLGRGGNHLVGDESCDIWEDKLRFRSGWCLSGNGKVFGKLRYGGFRNRGAPNHPLMKEGTKPWFGIDWLCTFLRTL